MTIQLMLNYIIQSVLNCESEQIEFDMCALITCSACRRRCPVLSDTRLKVSIHKSTKWQKLDKVTTIGQSDNYWTKWQTLDKVTKMDKVEKWTKWKFMQVKSESVVRQSSLHKLERCGRMVLPLLCFAANKFGLNYSSLLNWKLDAGISDKKGDVTSFWCEITIIIWVGQNFQKASPRWNWPGSSKISGISGLPWSKSKNVMFRLVKI